jgi:hypothetical protein
MRAGPLQRENSLSAKQMKKAILVILMKLVCVQAFCQCAVTTTQQDDNCGTCNGTATAFPSGTSPFSYSWSTGQTLQAATGLCQGLYTVTITDANSCTTSAVVSIQSSTGGAILSTTNATCNGCCDGGAMISPYGGCASYTYIWSPGGQATDSIGNLCAGNYIVQITDSCGCMSYVTASITEPPVVVDDLDASRLTIGPNPSFSGIFIFNAATLPPGSNLQIHDLSGKIIYRSLPGSSTEEIKLDRYPGGIYFYSIIDSSDTIISRGKLVSMSR